MVSILFTQLAHCKLERIIARVPQIITNGHITRTRDDFAVRTGRGLEAFSRAVSGESKIFLSQPIVQRFIDRQWHGARSLSA